MIFKSIRIWPKPLIDHEDCPRLHPLGLRRQLMANGLVIAAPRSGSGKTLVTLGLLAALRQRGLALAPAKAGPDYIDRAVLERVAGRAAINLDPWAMRPERLRALAARHGEAADLLLVEGVMGLFDGAADGTGSTADLAQALGLPVILVVDAERQGQSVAALVAGFAGFRAGVEIAGVILNRVATSRHERLLREALAPLGLAVLGCLPRRDALHLPERHLGLVLPDESPGFAAVVAAAAEAMEAYLDLNRLLALSAPLPAEAAAPPASLSPPRPLPAPPVRPAPLGSSAPLAPLGQRIAIARDDAFAFLYPHLLEGWRAQGAELSFFSPLAGEPARMDSDAVFLPGGYPELHGERIAAATDFLSGLARLRDKGALLYGECGGFMVLGETLTDRDGRTHRMAGLLPVATDISRPRRVLGYRRLRQTGPHLPWPAALLGHEFHYSAGASVAPLFTATDARGEALPPMGAVVGRVMGSYAHVIDVAEGAA
jgi:cobyrinic acid a,c-diamide synthase